MSEIIELNRNLFLKWVDGTLLERDSSGRCLVLDGSEFSDRCEKAVEYMDNGGTIYLTDNSGKRLTKMSLNPKEGYEESLVEVIS
jgi:hypothetical protein